MFFSEVSIPQVSVCFTLLIHLKGSHILYIRKHVEGNIGEREGKAKDDQDRNGEGARSCDVVRVVSIPREIRGNEGEDVYYGAGGVEKGRFGLVIYGRLSSNDSHRRT